MAAADSSLANGSSVLNGSSDDLTPAQKLHAEDPHRVTIEEVPDEEDLKHVAALKSEGALGSADGAQNVPSWVVPSWTAPPSAASAGKQKAQEPPAPPSMPSLDTQSHDLFPELGGAPKGPGAPIVAPIWSTKKAATPATARVNGEANGTMPTNGVSSESVSSSGVTTPNSNPSLAPSRGPSMVIPGRQQERIFLKPQQILPRTQLKRPINDVIKAINKGAKATLSMNTGDQGSLSFTATGSSEARTAAFKELCKQIGSKQSIKVPIPRSARAHIIGKGGSTIKAIQEGTGARIQMPKPEDNAAAENDDDDDDGTIDVVIEGDAVSTILARDEIVKIAGEKAANISSKLRGIPAEFYPFLAGPNNERVKAMEASNGIRVQIPEHHSWTTQPPPQVNTPGVPPTFISSHPDNHITLAGERLAVLATKAELERQAHELARQLTLEQLAINRGRHQFIIGDRGIPLHDFLAETGCAIILPADSEDDTITIVGPADQIQGGVEKAMDLATSMQSINVDISRQHRNAVGGAAAHARNVTRYLQRRNEIQRLERMHHAHIVTPIFAEGAAPWELYSRDGKNALRAQSEITSIVNGHPPTRMANLDIDPFFYQHLRKDVSPKVQEAHGVHVVIPEDNETNAQVLLVFEGPTGVEPDYQVPHTQPTLTDVRAFERGLEDARKHIMDIISGQEQIISQSIDVPYKFHEKLRRFIKREQQDRTEDQIPVRVSATGTIVTLRGTSSAVQALADKVNTFVAQELEDEKERGFTMSFDFPQKHANQLIGKGGSNISALRERFDVDIQVKDGKVELKGPKAKAEAAKSHITSQGKQWADEATHVLKVDPAFHRELIGAQGSQINKLQIRYKVQIHFPRSARPIRDDQSVADSDNGAKSTRRSQAEDEVVVRGPTKGANEARDEILSLLQYLKDNSHSATVSVQQSQVPSLIGQGGRGMDELRQTTGAKIDVPGSRDAKDPSGLADIQIKGTKAQVAAAKKLLEEKKAQFDQTVVKTLDIDKKHHRVLIGAGGSNLRDIIVKAGGSDDRRELARTVQFPRSEADGNSIKVEGNKDVVDKIIAAMQEIVAQRDSQTSETIDVPIGKHRSLIGRGGETKKSMEAKFNVSIDIPRQGSAQTGVKISGQPSDVAQAKAHLQEITKDEEGETVQIPRNVHHTISENGQFFRKLRNDHGVSVDHAGHQLPPKPAAPANTRANGGALPLITDDQDSSEGPYSWNVLSTSSDLDGVIPWVLRGPPASVEKAKSLLAAAIEQAQKNTTTGYLVLPDPKTYRYVIGQGGSKVNSIRKATGCKINVPKDQARDEAIQISGSSDGVEQAKDMILEAVKEGSANFGHGRS
ncbi:MAG: hypothetical protein M1818_006047 [Claussenomyces sp. TS43310]|nr:MAG: hypothetical protein M1818_006047 [Claussenomyces sp. TS43310]